MTQNYKDIKWWHKVKLNSGEYTPGICNIEKLKERYLFNDLNFKNKSVLDVGCWDGYYSFEAEKMGAKRIVSLDDCNFRWGDYSGYKFLHKHFNSKAELIVGNIYTLKKIFQYKEFDIILCYGVLYHLSDPLLALKNIFYVCENNIVFEGLFFKSDVSFLELIPLSKYGTDKGNVYNISTKYLCDVAKLCGFEVVKMEYTGTRATIILERVSNNKDFYNESIFPPVI